MLQILQHQARVVGHINLSAVQRAILAKGLAHRAILLQLFNNAAAETSVPRHYAGTSNAVHQDICLLDNINNSTHADILLEDAV